MSTCEKCGARCGANYNRCQTHRVSERNGDNNGDSAPTPADDRRVQCTDCGRIYEHPRRDECPSCGEERRRYIGPIEDDDSGFSKASLRDSERKDSMSHAERNAAMLRMADRELGGDGDRDE